MTIQQPGQNLGMRGKTQIQNGVLSVLYLECPGTSDRKRRKICTYRLA